MRLTLPAPAKSTLVLFSSWFKKNGFEFSFVSTFDTFFLGSILVIFLMRFLRIISFRVKIHMLPSMLSSRFGLPLPFLESASPYILVKFL